MLRVVSNGSIPSGSVLHVTFQDNAINSKYFTKSINASVTSGAIDITLINDESRVFSCGFTYTLSAGTLKINAGKYYNTYSKITYDYPAPTIKKILCITV